ncbi:manganese superoxide dismutase [Favolaschia claudopus]|uniref:Manganese superoxide dismutase n=1 Tax=Favolaschia claudopus TaxID=2862362 RepID=A0AAW0EAQ0_9AGAR
MSWLWRSRHALTRFRRPLIPRGTRGVAGQFDHQPLPLPYKIEDGLGDFLPPPALEAVAMEYQLGLLARLTDEVRNTDIEDASVTQIIISTAPFREKTLAFNYASLALNNSFFLGQLTPNIQDTLEPAIYPPLYLQIQTDHGGLEQLKSAFSAAAMGMFTSGYIWFVTDKYGSTSILPTLGPGTLLVRSRTYAAEGFPNLYHGMTASPFGWDKEQQYVGKYLADWGMDGRGDRPPILDPKHMSKFMGALDDRLPTLPSSSNGNYGANTPLQTRFMHLSARRFADWDASPPGIHDPAPLSAPSSQYKHTDALHVGEVLYPLFCLPVQEHAWLMAGYGVWGKEAWLREFWNVLNWRQVGQSYAHILKH